ncbi:hypothetical protein ACIQZG_11425 [Lysinibacillus sp. NPDC096418]|uniref:hypothetical protein n=1 Tax=Lysinibacillus sp. NPDC096418 TaxID=3364138 RepID=UPI003830DDE0
MKKLMGILFVVVLALTACNKELAITELESVPNDVEKALDQFEENSYVEKIYDVSKEISYIVINTKGIVTVSVESNDDKISIKIEEEDGQNEEAKQHIYKLTTDRDYEYILLYKNSEEIPFDVARAI